MRRTARPEAPPAQRATARIEAIGAKGDGVATLDGRAVFTPLTAPGDLAVIEARGDRGRLVELAEAGPDRADPPCLYYGRCGGCALQHVSSGFYRDWKRNQIIVALARVGLGDAPVADVVALPAASRRRATFAVRRGRDGAIFGFNARQSAEIVDLASCLVLAPALEARLPALRDLAAAVAAPAFDLGVTACANGLDADISRARMDEPRGPALAALAAAGQAAGCVRLSLDGEPLVTFAPPFVEFGGVRVEPAPRAFLQASAEGEAALIALITDAAPGARRIADLFCGSGSFTLPFARNASVHAADADGAGVAALLRAAHAAPADGLALKSVTAERRDLFDRPLQATELGRFDAIVFDPPRAGAAAQAAEIAKCGAKTVIGVSCNPATFARDAAILSQGGYALERVTPVDQFVYAAHVELVGAFRRP